MTRSAVERRAFALFAASHPLSTLTPEERVQVGRFLGIPPDSLETAYTFAMQSQQPPGGPWPEPASLSSIDKRAAQLRR